MDTIKRYLKKANYKLIPVQSDGVCMIAGPDEALGVYLFVRNLDCSIEKAVSRGANKLCLFRDKLSSLIQETLDDIEIKISLYLFCPDQQSISSQCRLTLSMMGVKLFSLDEPHESLNHYFPSFELKGVEVENYNAYVEYLQTVAKYITVSNVAPVRRHNEVAESIPLFQDMEDMYTQTSFKISSPYIIIDNTKIDIT